MRTHSEAIAFGQDCICVYDKDVNETSFSDFAVVFLHNPLILWWPFLHLF